MGDGHPCAFARRFAAALLVAGTGPVSAQTVQISNLADVSFGALPMSGLDATKAQSVCAYSGLLGGRYSITATGSGSGGAFTLTNGTATLPYEVQWSGTSGQSSGTNLVPGIQLSGQTMPLACPLLGVTDASLIIVVRGTSIIQASAGSYGGTLTILLAAG